MRALFATLPAGRAASVHDLRCTSVSFPLTPALSLGERENCFQRFGKATAVSCSTTSKFYEDIQRLFLLPKGEGQDEGEADDQ